MGKALENKFQKRSSLFDSAFHLFTTKGVENTSISDIARDANVGKGTFYLYFKSKQDLEAKLISHKAARLFEQAAEKLMTYPATLSLEDKVIVVVNFLLDQLIENPILLKFIYKNLSWGIFRNTIRSAEAEDSDDLISLDDLFGCSRDDFIEPDLMIYTIIEMASSTCYNVILWQEPVNIEVYRLFLDKNIRSIIRNHKR